MAPTRERSCVMIAMRYPPRSHRVHIADAAYGPTTTSVVSEPATGRAAMAGRLALWVLDGVGRRCRESDEGGRVPHGFQARNARSFP